MTECSGIEATPPTNGYINGTQVSSRWIRAMLEDANADPFTSRPTLPPRVETLRLSVCTFCNFCTHNYFRKAFCHLLPV